MWSKKIAIQNNTLLKLNVYHLCLALILLACLSFTACERDTKLRVTENNPPSFLMSGSGQLASLRVYGPNKQRDAASIVSFVYWQIDCKDRETAKRVGALKSIEYGKVPSEYIQVYPETGETPPLIEGESYQIHMSTLSANGAAKQFIISEGKAIELSTPIR